MDDSVLDRKIKEVLEKKAETVHADGLAGQRIRTAVYEKIEEDTNMKHKNWKKVILVTAAICVLGSITAAALGKPKYTSSHSYHNEEVTDYEEAKAMQKGFDMAAKMVEEFTNGYKFEVAVPQYLESHDEDHNTLETGTSMHITYAKEGVQNVSLSADRLTRPSERPDQTLVLEDGTELGYCRMAHKFVPPDYEPTEDELKLQEEGKLNIGYGSSEVAEMTSVSVSWKQDGVTYCLFSFNDELSAEELFQMAREVAESE